MGFHDHPRQLLYGVNWIQVLSILVIINACTIFMFYAISLIYTFRKLHKPVQQDSEKSAPSPGVSIIKPLTNLSDHNLIDNLETYFTLNYPQYEILFCVQDSEEVELTKKLNQLISKYPHVDCSIFSGAQQVGVNGKVNNMVNGYDNAKYPLILISDAGIRMDEDTLRDMVHHITEKVGLVHQIPFINDGNLSFARMVEKVYFGGSHARIYLSANAAGVNCMTSMSCIFRKKILDEEHGGLASLGCYLGEDFFLSQLIINKGWRVVLCSRPAQQNPAISTISAYKARMMRWMYLRMAAMPHLYILEPLSEHIFLAPLSALSVQYIFNIPLCIYLPSYIVMWCILDYILLCRLENRRPSFSIFSFVRVWIFRELLFLYLYINVLTMRHVVWAGNKYYVHYGGKTEHASSVTRHVIPV